MKCLRLLIILVALSLLGISTSGCQKPFRVPTAFDLNTAGAFYLERYFGQRFEDDDDKVHMSTGIHMWISKEIPIRSPVDGIMEWCPPGVWCNQAMGYGTLRVTLKPKKDQANELPDVKAVPQYVLVGGLQGSEVQKAVKALYLAEEASNPASPTSAEIDEAADFAEDFVKYGEAEPKAYVVRMNDELGKPRPIGAASLGPRGRITISVLDPKGYYLDPMIYLDLNQPTGVSSTAPVQALAGDTTAPEISQVTFYEHGGMSGTSALGVQSVDIGGTQVSSVVVPTQFDITVGVRDVGPPGCEAVAGGGNNTPNVTTCQSADPGGDPTMAIKRFDVEVFGLDPQAPPASPTINDYTYEVLTTPYSAGLYCLAEANVRLEGSGESDIGSDQLYNPFEAPVTATSPHVYNLANLRARPEAECLPETWRDEDLTTAGALDTTGWASGEYRVVVTATDFADGTDVYESWISVTSSAPSCDLEVSSCTVIVDIGDTSASQCGSGDPVTSVNLTLDIPATICQGTATLTLPLGDLEVFEDAACATPLTLPRQWNLANNEVIPSQIFVRAADDNGAPIDFQEVSLQLSYSNGASCSGSDSALFQGGQNAGPEAYEGNCCSENDSPGCADDTIASCVCATDPACCNGNWTEACAELADTSCNANCPAIDSECDNGVCEVNETPFSCPADCNGNLDINDPVPGFEACIVPTNPTSFAISNSTLVPFSINWTGPQVDFNGQDDQGLCSYEYVVPTLQVKTETLFYETMDLSQVTMAWKEQAPALGSAQAQTFDSAVLAWEGDYDVGPFGVVEGKVTEASIAINHLGELSGLLDFEVTTSGDANLGSNAILRAGIYGDFSFAFAGGTSWTGSWNFGGIEGIHIDLVRGTEVLATATGVLQPTGVLEATLVQGGQAISFTTFGIATEICDLSLVFNYNIANSHIDFISGTAAISVSGFTGLDGSLDLTLDFEPTQATVGFGLGLTCSCCTSGSSTLEVVGMELSDLTLTGVFNYDFDLISLNGTVSAEHPDFNTVIEGITYKIEDLGGNLGLSEFELASFTTGFQNFELAVTNASYSAAGDELAFSAKLKIPPLGEFSITNFKCNGNGDISIQKISGALTQSPLTGSFQASYQDDGSTQRFVGYINDLSIAGLVTVGAAIDVGTATNGGGPYTFLYLKIMAANLPIPFVKKFAATGGYNYAMDGIPGCPPGPSEVCTPFGNASGGSEEVNAPGYPSEGTYIVGLGIGVGDPAGLVGFDVYAQVQFGNGPTLLSGAAGVSIPQTSPWISGTVFINNYEFGGDSIAGGISTNVQIPRGNPWFFELNGTVTYESDESGWSVETPSPIVANLFWEFVQVQGAFNFSSQVSTIPAVLENSFNGYISGSIDVGGEFHFRYPNGFNSYSCSAADASDTSWGFGASGGIGLDISGSIGAGFNNDGMNSGSIGASASFFGYLNVKFPCPVICGSSCVSSYSVSASASLGAQQTNAGYLRVYGSASFSSSFGYDVSEYVDHTFD